MGKIIEKTKENPKVSIRKTIEEDKTKYSISIHYGDNNSKTIIYLPGKLEWTRRIRKERPYETEQEVAEAIKKQLERDRKDSKLPNLNYDITNVIITYIKKQLGSEKETISLKKNIEKYLE